MSDVTYALITSCADLFWGPPVTIANRNLARAVRSSYGYILGDLAGLVRPAALNLTSSPVMRRAETSIRARGARLAAFGPAVAVARSHVSMAAPVTPGNTAAVAAGASIHLLSTSLSLESAPVDIRRAHELLARTELACARGEVTVPRSPKLTLARQHLRAADHAITRQDAKEALRFAEQAAKATEAVEAEVARESAVRVQQTREAGEALARAGSLWVALESQEGLSTWLARHAGTQLSSAEGNLRATRQAYAEERFAEATQLARQAEGDLTSLTERASGAIAEQQRDANAAEAEKTLHEVGFATRNVLNKGRRVVSAFKAGQLKMTLQFDDQGRFEVDSREGYRGPTCAVQVNEFLRAFAEKVGFEVEGRKYIGTPDEAPGRTANAPANRRRLALSDILDRTANETRAARVPPQAVVAAWSRVAR
jgi:hypothetical protein